MDYNKGEATQKLMMVKNVRAGEERADKEVPEGWYMSDLFRG